MQSGYVKIYASILGSSVWAEVPATRIVWITLLALADQFGKIEASVSGLARYANVTNDQCREALDALASPDPDSKSPEHEGRRVEKCENGWQILNYTRYREMRSPKQVAEAERKARWRSGQQPPGVSATNGVATNGAEVEAADDEKQPLTFRERLLGAVPHGRRVSWEATLDTALQGLDELRALTPAEVESACQDFLGNGGMENGHPTLRHFKAYLKREAGPRAMDREIVAGKGNQGGPDAFVEAGERIAARVAAKHDEGAPF